MVLTVFISPPRLHVGLQFVCVWTEHISSAATPVTYILVLIPI